MALLEVCSVHPSPDGHTVPCKHNAQTWDAGSAAKARAFVRHGRALCEKGRCTKKPMRNKADHFTQRVLCNPWPACNPCR